MGRIFIQHRTAMISSSRPNTILMLLSTIRFQIRMRTTTKGNFINSRNLRPIISTLSLLVRRKFNRIFNRNFLSNLSRFTTSHVFRTSMTSRLTNSQAIARRQRTTRSNPNMVTSTMTIGRVTLNKNIRGIMFSRPQGILNMNRLITQTLPLLSLHRHNSNRTQ